MMKKSTEPVAASASSSASATATATITVPTISGALSQSPISNLNKSTNGTSSPAKSAGSALPGSANSAVNGPAAATAAAAANSTGSGKPRPCDACRRRKSRCVVPQGTELCLLCKFHSQECTFVHSPQPRKRRLASTSGGAASGPEVEQSVAKKRREPESPQDVSTIPVDEYGNLRGPSLLKATLGLQYNRHSQLIGPTSEYEACVIDLCPFDSNDEYSLSQGGGSFCRVGDNSTFIMYPDHPTQNYTEIFSDLEEIERIVAPHGSALMNLYFGIVHPSFPILQKKVFLDKYSQTHRELSPALLAAVYILASQWWSYDHDLSSQKKPDIAALEAIAAKAIADGIHRPKLSIVQAGLLLLQQHSDLKGGSWALTSQMVAVGQELGLHLDCTNWKIPAWERGLRKRLAWGLFMQDKWGALTHGRPSHIAKTNWAVPPVTSDDFPESVADEDNEERSDVEQGKMLFEQMISLSGIMADVLETFFTIEAQNGLSGRGRTNKVLEKAKPIQIGLKEWFIKLPECLRMDTSKARKLSSNGYLHLAYFATEITLHRQILRSLTPATNVDPYLLHICRSAAKTRLISAMDFVNRLKPEHLKSYWYFASKVNFALIGTFGSLLWATSPSIQEAEFYKARLSEYRWTLRVSSRGADFMQFAVGVLDASAGYMQQEQFKKRGFGNAAAPGYTSTVGVGEGFGLGMGVGLGLRNMPLALEQVPVQPPLPQWRGPEVTQQEQGQLSPVTGDEESEDGDDDDDDDGDDDDDDEGDREEEGQYDDYEAEAESDVSSVSSDASCQRDRDEDASPSGKYYHLHSGGGGHQSSANNNPKKQPMKPVTIPPPPPPPPSASEDVRKSLKSLFEKHPSKRQEETANNTHVLLLQSSIPSSSPSRSPSSTSRSPSQRKHKGKQNTPHHHHHHHIKSTPSPSVATTNTTATSSGLGFFMIPNTARISGAGWNKDSRRDGED